MNWNDLKLREGWFNWRRKRFWAWLALLTYTLVGAVVAPWVLRSVIVDAIHKQLALTARLDDVDLNPFVLSVRLKGFALDEPSGAALLSFDELYMNFELSSLPRRAWTFGEVQLKNPFIRFERNAQGRVNLTALAGPEKPAATSADEAPGESLRLLVEQFSLHGGHADVIDRAARTPLETQLGPIDIAVHGFSTLPDRVGAQEVTFDTERGGHVTWSGNLAFFPLRSEGKASITGIPLPKLSTYLPPELAIAITSGASDLSFNYTVAREAHGVNAGVRDFTLALHGMSINATGSAAGGQDSAELLKFKALQLEGGALSWPQRTVLFSRIALDAPVVALSRAADGRFVWQQLMQPAAVSTPQESTTPGPSAAPSEVAAQTPWSVGIERLTVADGVVRFVDQRNKPAAALGLTGLDLALESLSLEDAAKFPLHLNFAVEGGGTVALDGALTVLPALQFTAVADVAGLALPVAQPYVAAATNVEVESGKLNLKGTFSRSHEESLVFDGAVDVQDLNVLGEITRTRLIGWKRVAFDGLAVRSGAAHAEIASVTLDEPYGRVHFAKDGTLNLATVLRPDESAQAPETNVSKADDTKPWSVKVGRVRLVNGSTNYQDENLPIPFTIAVHTLNGEMGAFDTQSRGATKLRLEGQVGEFGAARIAGALQPLDLTRNSVIEANFENIALPAASPYSIRFAGHRIASGKLDMKLTYKLADGRLNGQQKIVLRDFALGEKVDYPDALNLPFGLAISLLKGPDGNIDVELPIEGDVNDPTFRIGGVIAKALVNLLTKIVTSPFRLLGNILGLGDSEQLDQITFPPGRAELGPPEREKVVHLADALTQRPQLTLQVPGVLDREADAAALRESQVNARVEAAVGGGDQSARRNVLEQLFAAQFPDEPLEGLAGRFTTAAAQADAASFDELAYLNEIQHRLVVGEPLAPDALDSLAAQRRAAVRDGVLASTTVEPTRVSEAALEEVKLDDNGVVAMTLKLAVAAAKP